MEQKTKLVLRHAPDNSVFVEFAGAYMYDSYLSANCDIVQASDLPAGTKIQVGCGYSTVLPDLDFETYSEAGYVFNESTNKWESVVNSPPHGIGAVGAAAYAEHPSTEVISLAYNLKDGTGAKIWLPGMPPPQDLFNHILSGGLLEAANSGFEFLIWYNICYLRMGWPPLPLHQLRDALAKCRAHSLPGSLGKAAKVLRVENQKIDAGKSLIKKFSIPRTPTSKDPRRRIRITDPDAAVDGNNFLSYNIGDIIAESDVSACVPDLDEDELELWVLDQHINMRGVAIDMKSVEACIAIFNIAEVKYTAEVQALTGGAVKSIGKLKSIGEWLESRGHRLPSLEAEVIEEALKKDLPPDVRRVLEIRSSLGAASVKKLFSIARRTSRDARIREIFLYCGADRTGRWAGRGPQPQNLPAKGPSVRQCDPVNGCGKHYHASLLGCPWCGAQSWASEEKEWGIEAMEDALELINLGRLDWVEQVFVDAVGAISGCLRGLFIAGPGKELICSDFTAIEAVVLAAISGEEWRLEVFRTHGKIYEMSAAKITGIPFEEFLRVKKETGQHHPMRKKVGKVAELASGFQGGVGAWKNFGADEFMTDEEILENVKKWRAESPNIVAFWKGIEEAALLAMMNPGLSYAFRGFTFGLKDDVLYCRLLSGRKLCYHAPMLHDDVTPWGKAIKKITYMGVDSKTKQWVRLDTYGGKFTENIVQATARDIMANAIKNVSRAGYNVVIHVHDEIAAEVDIGAGDVSEFEKLMATLPDWCAGWPIKAAGGWRGFRYRKD